MMARPSASQTPLPSRLLALDRGSFLTAVRGVPESCEAAPAVAER
ncbi:MAG: hypothetical protein QOJ35_1427 [Solirubrobacteraceae bacterium]|jgi:hypothetical protein|nr:hypothetical protein [Solirubrobacteraceae bacterium]